MSDAPYSNREIDDRFQHIAEVSDNNRTAILSTIDRNDVDYRNSLARLETVVAEGFKGVHERQDHTNGNVSRHEKILWVVGTAVTVIIVLKFPQVSALLHLV